MSNTVLHKADTRGHADHGWLNSYQSFSFAGYYNPERTQFGVLRVLNDDVVTGGKGFGSHPHDNMEIISIPLEGSLVHEDNMGHKEVVSAGEIQVMSTGSGVFHSEYNNSPDKPAKFLQIWLFPNKLNVTPRYDQVKLDPLKGKNQLQQLIAPRGGEAVAGGKIAGGAVAAGEIAGAAVTSEAVAGGEIAGSGEGTWIYQDAWFFSGAFDKGKLISYERKKKENGVYIFVIKGSFAVDGERLETRDGLGVTDVDSIGIRSLEEGSEVLIMDVPMKIKFNKMDTTQLKILAVGREPAILQVVERLINGHVGWAATVVTTDEDAMAAVEKTEFRIVFVCAGGNGGGGKTLRLRLQEIRPGVVVTRHFGGGSGLLENEVLAIINAQKK